jgi:hypothetical protein
MRPISDEEVDRLAWHIEARGLTGVEKELRRVVERARSSGVSPVLVDVLADPTEPEVARMRAFGHVALHMAAQGALTASDVRRPQLQAAS